jgi:MFS family permease
MRRPRPVTALLVEGFTSRLSFGVLMFALPLYALEQGMSIAAIGFLSAFAGIVSVSLKPITGTLADRWGVRRTLLWAMTLRSLLCLGYIVATAPAQLFAVRGVHGVSDALRDPAVHAMIAENGSKRSMASTFAWYQTAKTTAGSLGKALAGLLLATAVGFPLAFVVAFGLSLLPVLFLAAATRPPAPIQPRAKSPARHEAPSTGEVEPTPTRRPSGTLGYAGLGFLVAGTASMLNALFPILATEYAGLSTAQAGLVYLVGPAAALTGPLWGWVADRVSRPLVLAVRGVANVTSSLVYLVAPNPAGVWTGKALDDVGKAAFRPAWGSLMADVANRDPRTRARAMGFLTAGEDAGTIVGPIAAGLLWTYWGIPILLLARIVMAALSEVYSLRLERRQRRWRTPDSSASDTLETRCGAIVARAPGQSAGAPKQQVPPASC